MMPPPPTRLLEVGSVLASGEASEAESAGSDEEGFDESPAQLVSARNVNGGTRVRGSRVIGALSKPVRSIQVGSGRLPHQPSSGIIPFFRGGFERL